MASLKVFISSTCFDLGIVRSELRRVIDNLGHEPVLSEYSDILFDPEDHTHESCLKELQNIDMVVLVIGSRFGGSAIPKALEVIDIEYLQGASKGKKLLEEPRKLSITQCEILKAISLDVPIFTFVDRKVMSDHLIYEKNKNKPFINDLTFGAIEKAETASYIFEFINFIRGRHKNNAITEFDKVSDIELHLKKQWSAMLRSFLKFGKEASKEKEFRKVLVEGIEDIKALVFSTFSTEDSKAIAKAVLQHKHLIEFLLDTGLPSVDEQILQAGSWDELIERLGIKQIIPDEGNSFMSRAFLDIGEADLIRTRTPFRQIQRFADEWNDFQHLTNAVKKGTVDAIKENGRIRRRPIMIRAPRTDEKFKQISVFDLEDAHLGTSDILHDDEKEMISDGQFVGKDENDEPSTDSLGTQI